MNGDYDGGANDSTRYILDHSYRMVQQNASKLSSNRAYDPYRFKQVKSKVSANLKVQNKVVRQSIDNGPQRMNEVWK